MTRLRWTPVLFLLSACFLRGHPIPDLPLVNHFEEDGFVLVETFIDPRCFAKDPVKEPYLLNWVLEEMNATERAALLQQAGDLIVRSLQCRFVPEPWFTPAFSFSFEKKGGGELKEVEDKVFIRGNWVSKIEKGFTGYQAKALPESDFAVIFKNVLKGAPQRKIHVLFPDEESFVFNLSGLTEATANEEPQQTIEAAPQEDEGNWFTFKQLLRKGFRHVLPEGLDHILFVLGIFLLSGKWKPLLLQVTTFTVAHTITIALATMGMVTIDPSFIEPLIAASIVFIAMENVINGEYGHRRLVSVFLFGLIHGLGFASVSSMNPDNPSFLAELLGFTMGVDFGQLAVIGLAFAIVAMIALVSPDVRQPDQYRRFIVVPGSLVIALMGAYWTIERIFF
ncbi:MAG: HupE/UreJ family protein [Opitutales bacterium]|jgi:hydrogenase/urease accessory protein HupE